jgi:hypothetical protein
MPFVAALMAGTAGVATSFSCKQMTTSQTCFVAAYLFTKGLSFFSKAMSRISTEHTAAAASAAIDRMPFVAAFMAGTAGAGASWTCKQTETSE